MNDSQSHVSLLLLAVMGAPWLIDRAFTWLEDSAAYGRLIENRLRQSISPAHGLHIRTLHMKARACHFEGNTWNPSSNASPSL